MDMSEILSFRMLAKKVSLHTPCHFPAKMALHREGGKHKIWIFSKGQATAIFLTTDFGPLDHPKRHLSVGFGVTNLFLNSIFQTAVSSII